MRFDDLLQLEGDLRGDLEGHEISDAQVEISHSRWDLDGGASPVAEEIERRVFDSDDSARAWGVDVHRLMVAGCVDRTRAGRS